MTVQLCECTKDHWFAQNEYFDKRKGLETIFLMCSWEEKNGNIFQPVKIHLIRKNADLRKTVLKTY